MVAVRELVLNALIHRDYSIHTDSSPIRIMMFEDRMEIKNPGGLYGRLTLDNLGKIGADTRNPYIAGALEILINTENRFSGIPTVLIEMKKFGLRSPLFENNRGTFKVTLFNSQNKLDGKGLRQDDLTSEILDFCKNPRSRTELAEHFGFEAPSYMIKKYIVPLVEEGQLQMLLPEKPKSKRQKYVTSDLNVFLKKGMVINIVMQYNPCAAGFMGGREWARINRRGCHQNRTDLEAQKTCYGMLSRKRQQTVLLPFKVASSTVCCFS